jgi:hypothetical protein
MVRTTALALLLVLQIVTLYAKREEDAGNQKILATSSNGHFVKIHAQTPEPAEESVEKGEATECNKALLALLAEDEEEKCLDIQHYFAGDNKILEPSELVTAEHIVKAFAGGKQLKDEELGELMWTLRRFDYDGDKDLDAFEEVYLTKTVNYFADKDEGKMATTDAAPRLQSMKQVIDFFDGDNARFDLSEVYSMLQTLNSFDFARGKKDLNLDAEEQKNLITTLTYFQGDDKEADLQARSNFEKCVDFFDGNDDNMSPDEARRMLKLLQLMDLDDDRDLDKREQTLFIAVTDGLTTANVAEPNLEDSTARVFDRLKVGA